MSLFFETIKYENRVFDNLESHQKRVDKTFATFFKESTPFLLKEHLDFDGDGLFKCKVIYNKEIINIDFSPYHKRNIDTFYMKNCDIKYDYKYVNRDFFEDISGGLSSNEEVLLFVDNLLSDTTFSNVAIFYHDEWITPKSPLLEGCFLSTLNLKREYITKKMVLESTKIALINSMIGFSEIDYFILKDEI